MTHTIFTWDEKSPKAKLEGVWPDDQAPEFLAFIHEKHIRGLKVLIYTEPSNAKS